MKQSYKTQLQTFGHKSAVALHTEEVNLEMTSGADFGFQETAVFAVTPSQLPPHCFNGATARLRLGPFALPPQVNWGLAQGWQCWSESPIVSSVGVLGADLVKERHVFGDNHFYPYAQKPGVFHSWFYSLCGSDSDSESQHERGFLGADSGGGVFAIAFVYDLSAGTNLGGPVVWVDVDVEGFDMEKWNQKQEHLFRFLLPVDWNSSGSSTEDCALWLNWCSGALSAKVSTAPTPGYTSWYHHYANISANLLERNLAAAPTGLGIFQIDDGYQKSIGEWTETRPEFGTKEQLETLLSGIQKKGMKAGLWLAPFVSVLGSGLLQKHPDWLLRDGNGEPIRVGHIPHWGGDFFALDTERSDYKDWLRGVIDHWTARGVAFFKCDFLYAPGVTATGGLTRLQRASRAHGFLFEAVGRGKRPAQLLSCGAILDQAMGRCHASRVGADLGAGTGQGQGWDETRPELRWSREKVSTVSCLTNTLTRSPLSAALWAGGSPGNGAFLNDGDVSVVRSSDTDLTITERQLVAQVNARASDIQFVSCDLFAWDEQAANVFAGMQGRRWREVLGISPRGFGAGIAKGYTLLVKDQGGKKSSFWVDFDSRTWGEEELE